MIHRILIQMEGIIRGGLYWTGFQILMALCNIQGTEIQTQSNVVKDNTTHWAFLPIKNPDLPTIGNNDDILSPVDHFIIAQLEKANLSLSPQAAPGTIVRRLYFDLIGLPPTPDQINEFNLHFGENPAKAVKDLVDELLARPHYGERWARHWLDLARYADSDGQETDADRPTAYHYRDFVIRSFNKDLPFDTFVRWQLAGDELAPNNPDAIAATGFLVAGTYAALPANLMEDERMRNRFNELDDMISTTGAAFLGLTLGCARCHDHKYDPVPTMDYYRMLSAFNGGDRSEVPLVSLKEIRLFQVEEDQWKKELRVAKEAEAEWFKKIRILHESEALQLKIDSLDVTALEKEWLKSECNEPELVSLKKKHAKQLKVENQDLIKLLNEDERKVWIEHQSAVQAIESRRPRPLPTALAFADFSGTPRETHLLARGDFNSKSQRVTLGFLSALNQGKDPQEYWDAALTDARRPNSTQQRRAMAEWITDIEHGAGNLMARVMVNRLWQHHFGQGLVRSVNDFGTRCDPPTHPDLLEWLAHQLIVNDWNIKPLHRLILNSAVYLQGTDFDAGKSKKDPENRLLWRKRPMRLEAEILRDSMLAVSGRLNPDMFGPAVKAPIAPEAIQARNVKNPYPKDLKDTNKTHRRSIYLFHKRVVQNPLMQAFDGPDAQTSCGRRETTTVAPQALALLNDDFVRSRALDFALRLEAESETDLPNRIQHGWFLALGRIPDSMEQDSSKAFIQTQIQRRMERGVERSDAERLAMTDWCQSLFALNEFIYVD